MDQLTVDVTDIPNVRVGSEAVLIGEAGGEKIFAPRLAGACETIKQIHCSAGWEAA